VVFSWRSQRGNCRRSRDGPTSSNRVERKPTTPSRSTAIRRRHRLGTRNEIKTLPRLALQRAMGAIAVYKTILKSDYDAPSAARRRHDK